MPTPAAPLRPLWSFVALVMVAAAAAPAAASELRFSATAPGGIIATGNTLGLSKETSLNGPGVRDSIGTFVTLDATVDNVPLNAANPYPTGTTSDWHANGSAAFLTLREGTGELSGADVLYAELLWGGSYSYGAENVTADLETPVSLGADSQTIAVAPDPLTALTTSGVAVSGFPVNYYLRSADVTDFIRTHRSGEYTVRGVPATQTDTINSLNAAGWTLVVAYRDDNEPLRNLTVFVGGSFVDENTQEDYAVSGFCAPPSGEIVGKVALSAIEGDANLTGDQLLIAPDVASVFVPLQGPNNPVDNFFCSQLNDELGQLDASGTFGLVNQDALGGANVPGGRQGWDVTAVALSSSSGQLVAGQQSAVLRTVTTGDSFVPTLAAFQIDVNAPNLTTSSLVPDHNSVQIGDHLIVTSVAHNTGLADASSLRFKLPLADGLALVSFTSDGNAGDLLGNTVTAQTLATGVDEGNLAPGGTRTLVIELSVTGPAVNGLFFIEPVWSFEYVTCQGSTPLSETYTHGAIVTFVDTSTPDAGTTTGTDAGTAAGDDAGTGSDVDAGTTGSDVDAGNGNGNGGVGLGDGNGDGVEGCGCSSHGPASTLGGAACLLALAAVGRRARRRSAVR